MLSQSALESASGIFTSYTLQNQPGFNRKPLEELGNVYRENFPPFLVLWLQLGLRHINQEGLGEGIRL